MAPCNSIVQLRDEFKTGQLVDNLPLHSLEQLPEFQAFGEACSSSSSSSNNNSQLLFNSYRDAGVLSVIVVDPRLLLRTNLALVGGSSRGTHS